MSWPLVARLSLLGLLMGIATVFVIPSNVEPLCWLVIFAVSAYLIAKRVAGKYFLHGLLVGIANSVWVTAAHVVPRGGDDDFDAAARLATADDGAGGSGDRHRVRLADRGLGHAGREPRLPGGDAVAALASGRTEPLAIALLGEQALGEVEALLELGEPLLDLGERVAKFRHVGGRATATRRATSCEQSGQRLAEGNREDDDRDAGGPAGDVPHNDPNIVTRRSRG